jgi:hypothetical protein
MPHAMTPPPTWGAKKKTATYSNLKRGRGLHVTDANFFSSASTQSVGAGGADGGTKGGPGPGQHQQQRGVAKPLVARAARVAAAMPAQAERVKPAAQVIQQGTKTPHSRAVRRLALVDGGSNNTAGRHIGTESRLTSKTNTKAIHKTVAAADAEVGVDSVAAAAAAELAPLRKMQALRAALRAEYAAADQSLREEQQRLLDEVDAIEAELEPVKTQLALDIVSRQ